MNESPFRITEQAKFLPYNSCSIFYFFQNQKRIVRQNYQTFVDKDYITGMEVSVAN